MSDNFYRAFEEKHRGTRDLIKLRQRVYLPFIEPIQSIYNDAKAIDLGCGRGEWLELLAESGFDAQGVDLDDGMLTACHERGLNVASSDAVAALNTLPNESQLVVSGFHIAEHLPFSVLQTLVKEALRVLKPGGLLILETPNPENIVVGSCNFYLDPTHQRPIPPQLLAFLTEHYGFARTKILRLHESSDFSGGRVLSLIDVLGGASPDYAVVGQKAGHESILAASSQAFDQEYGISLVTLADKYNDLLTARGLQSEAKAEQAETKAQQAETKAQQAETKAQQAETKAQQAETKAQQAEAALQAIYNSSSWRITILFRVAGNITKSFFNGPKLIKSKIKTKLKFLLQHAVLYTLQRPKVKGLMLATLGRFPAVRSRLMQVTKAESSVAINQLSTNELAKLTPRAIRIYADFKAAIERNKK